MSPGVGDTLHHPVQNAIPIAHVKSVFEDIPDEQRFPGIVDLPDARYTVDCAFAELRTEIGADAIDPRVPWLEDGVNRPRTMGAALEIDLETMGPVGQAVVGTGRTRRFQRGHIAAFAYTYSSFNSIGTKNYTDYLIVGQDGDQFSAPGDSGKLIVTDEERPRPVALLWGGWKQRARRDRMQEDWTYAIDINTVLGKLGASIIYA